VHYPLYTINCYYYDRAGNRFPGLVEYKDGQIVVTVMDGDDVNMDGPFKIGWRLREGSTAAVMIIIRDE
jgi:hypothetical protein